MERDADPAEALKGGGEALKTNEYADLFAEAKTEAAAERRHLADVLATEAERLNADSPSSRRIDVEGAVKGIYDQLAELRREFDVEGDVSEAKLLLVEQINDGINGIHGYQENVADLRAAVRREAEVLFDVSNEARQDEAAIEVANAAVGAAETVEQALSARSSGYREEADVLIARLALLGTNEKLPGPQRERLHRTVERLGKATDVYARWDEAQRQQFSQLLAEYKASQ